MSSSLKDIKYTTLDVFTTSPLQGNQLALVTLPKHSSLTQTQKLKLANEFNYSETVYLYEDESSEGNKNDTSQQHKTRQFSIFTVNEELTFAGHPTIGTACYLAQQYPEISSATLNAKAGPIEVTYDRSSGSHVQASARIPHDVHVHSAQAVTRETLAAQQPSIKALQRDSFDDFTTVSIVKGMTFILVKLPSRDELRNVSTCTVTLNSYHLDAGWNESFVATYFYFVEYDSGVEHQGKQHYKIHTRMVEGPLEDPATGSAACTLAAAWALRQAKKSIHVEITQGEDLGRRSDIVVDVQLQDSGKTIKEVVLSGSAVRAMEGRLL